MTVEAASPALIGKVRSVVTDGTGQYRIVDLRPGLYTVTFTLPGFNVVQRQGIELTGSFTATVNAELRVGAVEETITVTGETPTVDVQSATYNAVFIGVPWDGLDRAQAPISVTEQSTGLVYRSNPTFTHDLVPRNNTRAALSYITGAHSLKIGFNNQNMKRLNKLDTLNPLSYRFNGPGPTRKRGCACVHIHGRR